MAEKAKPNFWPAENPAVIAHMNMLQAIINRLATQSSSCKTWCLTLVAALISFSGATTVPSIVAFAVVPIGIFGFLDAMYLAQEKAFRDLFEKVADSILNEKYGKERFFAVSAHCEGRHVMDALVSWSIWPVYGGMLIICVFTYRSSWLAALNPIQS